jgi:hypothetical protein
MKKILTLAFLMGTLNTVFAQNGRSKDGRNESRDIVYGKSNNQQVFNNTGHGPSGGGNNYSFTVRDRDVQILRINQEFDSRIMTVKRNRYLRNGEKKRQIRILENERTQQIMQLNQRFSNQKSYHYNDHNDYDNKNDRKDNRKY